MTISKEQALEALSVLVNLSAPTKADGVQAWEASGTLRAFIEQQQAPAPASVQTGGDAERSLHLRVVDREPLDWPVGDYECKCVHCEKHYIGPKRSCCCRLCATPAPAAPASVAGSVPKDPEVAVRAIAKHIDGWRSSTFGWQDDSDPAQSVRNKQAASRSHAAECLRRIEREVNGLRVGDSRGN